MSKLLLNLFAPTDTSSESGGAKTGSVSNQDTYDFLKSLDTEEPEESIDLATPKKVEKEEKEVPPEETDEEPEKDKEKEDTDGTDDDDDELKALEEELDEPSEEQLELTTPVRRREILKKYPELFKDFPYLERAYYREQQFTEVFPTIDDAKDASEKSKVLDAFEADLGKGDIEKVLQTVKESDQNAFHTIIDNYMTTLAVVDEKAYHHVLGNVIKTTIQQMVREARANNNDSLQEAAHLLNQFVFGSSTWTAPTTLSKPKADNSGEEKLREREREITMREFTRARDGLNTKVNNSLRSTIDQHIDPRESMTSYIKGHAVTDAMDNLRKLIDGDTRFKSLLDKLWQNAHRENFSDDSIGKIRSAYVSKAKTLLPSVIKKARIDALKGMGKRVKEDKETETDTNTETRTERPKERPKRDSAPQRPRGQQTDSDRARQIPKGMSTLDFLNSD